MLKIVAPIIVKSARVCQYIEGYKFRRKKNVYIVKYSGYESKSLTTRPLPFLFPSPPPIPSLFFFFYWAAHERNSVQKFEPINCVVVPVTVGIFLLSIETSLREDWCPYPQWTVRKSAISAATFGIYWKRLFPNKSISPWIVPAFPFSDAKEWSSVVL